MLIFRKIKINNKLIEICEISHTNLIGRELIESMKDATKQMILSGKKDLLVLARFEGTYPDSNFYQYLSSDLMLKEVSRQIKKQAIVGMFDRDDNSFAAKNHKAKWQQYELGIATAQNAAAFSDVDSALIYLSE